MLRSLLFFPCAFLACIMPAEASTFSYVEWTSATASTVSGTLLGGVTATYSGEITLTQLNNAGPNYWLPTTTLTTNSGASIVSNAPSNSDIIALNGTPGFTNTVTFSTPLNNVIMDIFSLGQPGGGTSYTFNTPFSILQIGPSAAYNGGTDALKQSGNVLTGEEGDGIIEFSGPVTSISWTGTNPEFWNGFTFGALSAAAPTAAPEPATWSIAAIGLLLLGARSMKRRS